MPSLFIRTSTSVREKSRLNRKVRSSKSQGKILVSSISRPEKLLIDSRFAKAISRFLDLTPDSVKYRLYSDKTNSSHNFVECITENATHLKSRFEIVDQFNPDDL